MKNTETRVKIKQRATKTCSTSVRRKSHKQGTASLWGAGENKGHSSVRHGRKVRRQEERIEVQETQTSGRASRRRRVALGGALRPHLGASCLGIYPEPETHTRGPLQGSCRRAPGDGLGARVWGGYPRCGRSRARNSHGAAETHFQPRAHAGRSPRPAPEGGCPGGRAPDSSTLKFSFLCSNRGK